MTRLMVRMSAVTALMVALITSPAVAWAAQSTEIIQGEYLRIESTADWDDAQSMGTTDAVQWDLEVSADAPEPGSVAIELSAQGDMPLVLTADTCSEEWDAAECPGEAQVLLFAWDILRDGTRTPLTVMASTDVTHLRLTITLDPKTNADAGATEVRVHAEGAGDSISVTPDGPLAPTGLVPIAPWIMGSAAVLVLAGLLMVLRRRRADDKGERP